MSAPLRSRLLTKFRLLGRLGELDKLDRMREAIGRIEARQLEHVQDGGLRRQEFTVYSQRGEDGILHWLIRSVAIPRRVFVEFGVGNYREANTRFLATNDRWSGLVMDSDAINIRQIQSDPVYWQIDVRAVHAFVTRDNINDLLRDNGIIGEIGLLSIDIDGNDYWVFEAIDVIRPALVVIEYNSRFGPSRAVTIPYDPAFNRWRAHPSGLYAGASLRAMCNLAYRKGYSFVGCNSFGVNAFFVRTDLLNDRVPVQSVEDGFVAGQFREARDARGRLALLGPEEEQRILASMPLVTLDEGLHGGHP
jgi:hypothetical protein